jgi:2',3'-cyclic-nucleotide 2'-phosphodiesterase (5'-nucleotidase family)
LPGGLRGAPARQQTLEPILRRHHVDLVLAGHDHHYERTHPIDGITYVVSGGGCKTTRVGRSDFTAVFWWLEPHPVRGRRAVAARVRRAPATRPSGRHDRDAPTRA